jgi:hypothetical protein
MVGKLMKIRAGRAELADAADSKDSGQCEAIEA